MVMIKFSLKKKTYKIKNLTSIVCVCVYYACARTCTMHKKAHEWRPNVLYLTVCDRISHQSWNSKAWLDGQQGPRISLSLPLHVDVGLKLGSS